MGTSDCCCPLVDFIFQLFFCDVSLHCLHYLDDKAVCDDGHMGWSVIPGVRRGAFCRRDHRYCHFSAATVFFLFFLSGTAQYVEGLKYNILTPT